MWSDILRLLIGKVSKPDVAGIARGYTALIGEGTYRGLCTTTCDNVRKRCANDSATPGDINDGPTITRERAPMQIRHQHDVVERRNDVKPLRHTFGSHNIV